MRVLTRFACSSLVVLALAALATSAHAQDAAGFAQQLFTSGVAHFDAGELAPARDDFQRSLSLFESPNTRLYLGRTLRELGQLPEAILELERASREASDRAATDPRYARTRDVARDEAAALEPRVGRIVVVAPSLPADARVTIAGASVPTAALGAPIRVVPGEVTLVVEAPGFERHESTATVAAGESTSVTLELLPVVSPIAPAVEVEPAPEPTAPAAEVPSAATSPDAPSISSLTVAGASLLGIGVALGVGAMVTGVMTIDRYDHLRATCAADGGCPASSAGEISEGATLANTTTGLIVGASVAGVAGVVLLVLGALEPPRASEHARLRLVPGPGVVGGGLAWTF